MEEEFRNIIKTASQISSLIGTRVYWGAAPQGEHASKVVMNVISGVESLHMNGKGPFVSRIQADAYGTTFREATMIERALLEVLNCYRGGGFLFIRHVSTRKTRESGEGVAAHMYRAGMDFETTWRPI